MSDWLKELEKKIGNPHVSDQEVYDTILNESADQTPQQGSLSQEEWQKQTEEYDKETERLRELMKKVRPQVFERIIDGVLEQHQNCCGTGCGNCE